MQTSTSNKAYYWGNRNYFVFSGYFFTYFFIMATCYPFLGIWLGDINGLSGEERGIVFAAMSFLHSASSRFLVTLPINWA